MSKPRLLILGLLISLLAGCGGSFIKPKEAPSGTLQESAAAVTLYTVQRGDTLYSIARRYNQSVNTLAAWNNLRPPYSLTIGQRLRVLPSAPAPAPATAARPATGPVATGGEALRRLPAGTLGKKNVQAVSAGCPASGIVWHWPALGQVQRNIAATGRIGLNIFGTLGQPVYATANGWVVYSGPGLNGYYGNLIIVRHDPTYMSVYAYNRARYVAEGQYVAAGQPIAEMGTNNNNQAVLHFEVTCLDKTLDPLLFLPR